MTYCLRMFTKTRKILKFFNNRYIFFSSRLFFFYPRCLTRQLPVFLPRVYSGKRNDRHAFLRPFEFRDESSLVYFKARRLIPTIVSDSHACEMRSAFYVLSSGNCLFIPERRSRYGYFKIENHNLKNFNFSFNS